MDWYPKIEIASDGNFFAYLANGTKTLVGSWVIDGRMLRVTLPADTVEAARRAGTIMNEEDIYPVIYADAHDLVMTPGISVAGRFKFTK